MRSISSVKNGIVSSIMYIITIIMGFVTQKVFISTLGNEYLGINSLLNNIISMLSIAELGLGSAIIYNLYKPIAQNNIEEIKKLVNFYKKCYRIIAIIIAGVGMAIIPFLDNIVGTVTIQENIIFIYLLFLTDTIVSYLLTYKRSIFYASQQTYIINIVHIFYVIVMNIIQIITLITTNNFVLYLIIKIIFRIIENIIISIMANKKYPYLKQKDIKKISPIIKKDIFTKVKGLIFHRVGSFIVLGTDNIIISKFLGIITVGLYSNYYMIINAVNCLFVQVFSSIVASVGNLLTEENVEMSYNVHKKMMILTTWIFTYFRNFIIIYDKSIYKDLDRRKLFTKQFSCVHFDWKFLYTRNEKTICHI